jgi:hypothetical protein
MFQKHGECSPALSLNAQGHKVTLRTVKQERGVRENGSSNKYLFQKEHTMY